MKILVVGGIERAEFPLRQSLQRGELVVADHQHFDPLGLIQQLFHVFVDGAKVETAEVELDCLLRAALLKQTLVDGFGQFAAHLI